MWLRYVDATFVIWRHGEDKLEEFTKYLNTQSPNKKLTTEKEQNKQLAVLNVTKVRGKEGLKTYVWRNAHHIGRYLNYNTLIIVNL